ncbi:MAG: hypothetical protein WBA97_01180 [Actinophytocola sp.]|uniref:hypothetical protein n=1 Tax=Actinophytocola sp. TaxID=1872138 RepID=UPI003C70CE87
MRTAKPEPILSAAERLGRISDGLKDAEERVNTTVRQPLGDDAWRGAASTAALARIDQVGKDVARSGDVVAQTGAQVRKFGDALAEAKVLVARADDMASGARLTIGPDGSVTIPSSQTEAEAEALKATGAEVHRMLGTAVTMASAADEACAGALAEAAQVGETAGIAMGSPLATAALTNGGDDRGLDVGNMDHLEEMAVDHVLQASLDDLFGPEVVDTISEEGVWAGVNEWWDQSLEDMTSVPDLSDLFESDGFDIGNMNHAEETVFDYGSGASPDDLFGPEVVDTISEEGVLAGVDEWWDQSWEDMTEIPDGLGNRWDDLSEGVEHFADDPVGTIGGLF